MWSRRTCGSRCRRSSTRWRASAGPRCRRAPRRASPSSARVPCDARPGGPGAAFRLFAARGGRRAMPENRTLRGAAALAAAVLGAAALVAAGGHDARAQDVGEKLLLDNDRVMVYEFLFPPGFRGEEHAAAANELAYVLDGEFVVVTKGQGTRTVKPGEVEYAATGRIHASLNETSRPARALVVILKRT